MEYTKHRNGKCQRKKSRNRLRKIVLLIAILAVFIVPRIVRTPAERSEYRLLGVIDGDTISVLYEKETVSVRLIGVDAPESVHPNEINNTKFGAMASQHTEELLAETDYVYLEFDEEKCDSYDRLLAYVYLNESADFESSINYRLIEDGYAVNKEYRPNVTYARVLEGACREARQQKKGLWGMEGIEMVWGNGDS